MAEENAPMQQSHGPSSGGHAVFGTGRPGRWSGRRTAWRTREARQAEFRPQEEGLPVLRGQGGLH